MTDENATDGDSVDGDSADGDSADGDPTADSEPIAYFHDLARTARADEDVPGAAFE